MSTNKTRSITIQLEEPVTVEGTTYTELTFRRMKARDALVAEGEKNKTRAGYILYAALANVTVEVIEELDADDLAAVSEVAPKLMGKQAQAQAERQRKLMLAKMNLAAMDDEDTGGTSLPQ